MKDDKETNQIIRTVKELFMKNIKNNRELSNLIDKYLIPQELEKKSNAEVSTPFKLRQEMLNKIPVEFWTSIKKVVEPCAGKGGFIVDIIDRFMIGLEKTIPDEKERLFLFVFCFRHGIRIESNTIISKELEPSLLKSRVVFSDFVHLFDFLLNFLLFASFLSFFCISTLFCEIVDTVKSA